MMGKEDAVRHLERSERVGLCGVEKKSRDNERGAKMPGIKWLSTLSNMSRIAWRATFEVKRAEAMIQKGRTQTLLYRSYKACTRQISGAVQWHQLNIKLFSRPSV